MLIYLPLTRAVVGTATVAKRWAERQGSHRSGIGGWWRGANAPTPTCKSLPLKRLVWKGWVILKGSHGDIGGTAPRGVYLDTRLEPEKRLANRSQIHNTRKYRHPVCIDKSCMLHVRRLCGSLENPPEGGDLWVTPPFLGRVFKLSTQVYLV